MDANKMSLSGLGRGELLKDVAAFESLRKTSPEERLALEREFVMWEAVSDDEEYLRHMQAHNI